MRITTSRLVLREFEESDWLAALEYEADPEVVRYKGSEPATELAVRERIQRAADLAARQPRTLYEFAVTTIGKGVLIGRCNLTIGDPRNQEANLGYTLNPRFWGQGFATEAARALLALGFGELGLHRISAFCALENAASYRVMERLGMSREGVFRQHRWFKERWWDFCYYAILEHEWREQARNSSR